MSKAARFPGYGLLLGLMAALPACSLQPDYKRPPMPTAGAYAPDLAPEADGPLAVDVGWRGFFPDVRLQRFIELALANNRDLRQAVLRIEEALGDDAVYAGMGGLPERLAR